MNVGHGWGYLSMAAKNSNILIYRTMAPCIRVSLKGQINLERSYLSYSSNWICQSRNPVVEVLRGALVVLVGREGRQGRVAKTLGRLPTHPQPQGQRQPNPPGQLVTSSFNNTNTQGWFDKFGKAIWADTAPFMGPWLASCVASGTTEIQGHCQVCRARRGGPRTPSTTTDANLDCAFVENTLFDTNPWLWKVNRIELS